MAENQISNSMILLPIRFGNHRGTTKGSIMARFRMTPFDYPAVGSQGRENDIGPVGAQAQIGEAPIIAESLQVGGDILKLLIGYGLSGLATRQAKGLVDVAAASDGGYVGVSFGMGLQPVFELFPIGLGYRVFQNSYRTVVEGFRGDGFPF